MVLRSGIIIPFQFRDSKKLLMVGVPGENRNLNIWDLRNVVRAAFGIYNFEFRNKKIGFNIPDELLLHYLAQRHDLTNFVIEIGQDPSLSTSDNVLVAPPTTESFVASNNNLQINENSHIPEVSRQEFRNPFDGESAFTSATEALNKGCGVYQDYADQNERSKLHLIAEKHLNSKSEQIERKMEEIQKTKEHTVDVTHVTQDQQQQQQRESPLFSQRAPFEFRGDTDIHIKKVDYQQNPFAACAMNRFRIYDPCKDNFTSMGGCATCHGPPPEQKPTLDIHENTNTSTTYHSGVGGSRSNASATSPQSSQNANELPTLKMRMSHGNNILSTHEVSHMEIEPKIDYDAPINTAGGNTDAEDSTPPPMTVHVKTNLYADEDQQQQQQQHQQQQDFHLERLQHEYALQQQHHFEAFMQENSSGNSLRQRKERMSKKQKEIYVHFLEQNPIINEHRRSDPILDQYWIKLADILNTVPQGAIKHVAEWKQTFDNWRYRVFLYARYNSKVTGPDALNPKSFKPLTHTDKRAYHIWIRNPDTAPPDLEKMRNVFVNLEETQQE